MKIKNKDHTNPTCKAETMSAVLWLMAWFHWKPAVELIRSAGLEPDYRTFSLGSSDPCKKSVDKTSSLGSSMVPF